MSVILSFIRDVEIPVVDHDSNAGWQLRQFTKGENIIVEPCEQVEAGACFAMGSTYIECIPWDAFTLNGRRAAYDPESFEAT